MLDPSLESTSKILSNYSSGGWQRRLHLQRCCPNIERLSMEEARALHERPELYNQERNMRLKVVKIPKDQRDQDSHFIKSEIDEMNESVRRKVVTSVIRWESLLGALPLQEPKSRASLKQAADKVTERDLLAKAMIDELDSSYWENLSSPGEEEPPKRWPAKKGKRKT